MDVLVVWASRLGSTREIAERIAGRLEVAGATPRVEAASDAAIRPDDRAVILGSAVYAGRWLKPAVAFARRNESGLVARPVWLFSSGPVGNLATRSAPVDPKEIGELRRTIHPREHRVFAGALDRADIDGAGFGRIERFVAKLFVPEGDYRDWAAIDAWADGIAGELAAATSV
jgi:menaquinone-dependent protoporphyrinogen oxidase